MKKNTPRNTLLAACVFSAGYFVGALNQSRYLRKRLNKATPLISSSLANILEKFQEDEMTYDEIREYAKNELDFLQIVIKGGK
jgi:hypothetical protein